MCSLRSRSLVGCRFPGLGFKYWINLRLLHPWIGPGLKNILGTHKSELFGSIPPGWWIQMWSKTGCKGRLEHGFSRLRPVQGEKVELLSVNSRCFRIWDLLSLDVLGIRRIYTTFILGTALQNFGTRANSFGHGPLDLHDKICSSFFNVDFWNGTPETRTALLILWVPALIWQRFTCDFKRASGMSGALLRAVQKKKKNIADSRVQNAIVWLVALKKWKRLSQ